MSEFKSSSFRNEDNSGAPDIVGVTTFTSPYYFVPPSGTTAERPSGDGLAPGMLRFNTDIGRLEVWRGDHWATILGQSPNLGVNGALGARGVFAGGYSPTRTNIIDYVTISTLGDAQDFGDLLVATEYPAGTSDSTRGLVLGGQTPISATNTVVYVTIASTGNATDFGDLINALRQKSALANSTRAIANGGNNATSPFVGTNVMDYFTIQSTGNGQDFGDLSAVTNYPACAASSTRGIFAGHTSQGPPTSDNVIDYVTIATTGNVVDFGDLDYSGSGSGLSNSTRGVFSRGGSTALDYVTIATLGNSQDFGTLIGNARYNTDAAVSSPTRGLFMVGAPVGNTINYITILSTGNAQDFGDLTRASGGDAGFSNAHGGL